MDSGELTELIMNKLKSLKLLKDLEEHVQDSIGIIIEETIDHNLAKVTPRRIHLQPTIRLERCELHIKGGPPHGQKSQFKFHMMSLGDVLVVEEDIELIVHQQFNYYIQNYKPNWAFAKSKKNGEVRFKRIF